MALQPPLREALGLAAAAVAATAFVVLFGAAYNQLVNRQFPLEQLPAYVVWVVSLATPVAVVGCLIAAPALLMLRRRGKLRLSSTIGSFAAVAFGVLVVEAVVLPGMGRLSASEVLGFGLFYIVSGVIGGIAYWAIAVAPSNSTPHADARASSVLNQPPSARAGERGR